MSKSPRMPLNKDALDALQEQRDAGTPLNEVVPFRAPDGVQVSELKAHCAVCNAPIDPKCVHVETIEHSNGVIEMRAIGLCCRTATQFLRRFRPEGALEAIVGRRWRRFHWQHKASPWWDLLSRLRDTGKRLGVF